MSNAEDLNRLTACSLVLLGHIFYVLGNHRESNNMVVPAMQLASKIPDMLVQLWSSALLRDLNKACGNAMDAHEAAQMHQNFSQQLLQDHIEACSLPEHNLITFQNAATEATSPPDVGIHSAAFKCVVIQQTCAGSSGLAVGLQLGTEKRLSSALTLMEYRM
ncbi:Mau2 Chromatid Cohesion Factor-like [Manis pentadactyla]|nr:Mau2 Chromatid Cohesion Factor-like [Manis pentadactyla]